jgi:hypothetical protein
MSIVLARVCPEPAGYLTLVLRGLPAAAGLQAAPARHGSVGWVLTSDLGNHSSRPPSHVIPNPPPSQAGEEPAFLNPIAQAPEGLHLILAITPTAHQKSVIPIPPPSQAGEESAFLNPIAHRSPTPGFFHLILSITPPNHPNLSFRPERADAFSSFAPAKESAREVEESLFDLSRKPDVPH